MRAIPAFSDFDDVAAVSRSFQALAIELIYDADTIEFLCTGSYRKSLQFRTTPRSRFIFHDPPSWV